MALRSCDQNIQSVKKKSRVYVEIRMHDYNRMLNSDTFFYTTTGRTAVIFTEQP